MLLLVLMLLLPWMFHMRIPGGVINTSVADAFFLVVGMVVLLKAKQLFQNKRFIYVGYFALIIASILVSHLVGLSKDQPTVTRFMVLLEIIKTIVSAGYFMIAYLLIRSRNDLTKALYGYVYASIPATIIGLFAYVTFIAGIPVFLHTLRIGPNPRFTGTFMDPNLTAFYYLSVLFVSIWLYQTTESKPVKAISGANTLLTAVLLLLTLSRGGLLAALIAMIVLLIMEFRRLWKPALVMVLVTSLSLFAFIAVDHYMMNGRFTNTVRFRYHQVLDQGPLPADGYRMELTTIAFDLAVNNPIFGVGKGNYGLIVQQYSDDHPTHIVPHNTPLSFFAQQGLIGFLIFVSLPLYLFYRLFKSKDRTSRYLLAMLLAWGLHALTINVENIRFMWFMAGLILAGLECEKETFNAQQPLITGRSSNHAK